MNEGATKRQIVSFSFHFQPVVLLTTVSFILFLVFGFWSLATKLLKYITLSLSTFCKARGARKKKRKENHGTKIPKIKRRKYGMNETKVTTLWVSKG